MDCCEWCELERPAGDMLTTGDGLVFCDEVCMSEHRAHERDLQETEAELSRYYHYI